MHRRDVRDAIAQSLPLSRRAATRVVEGIVRTAAHRIQRRVRAFLAFGHARRGHLFVAAAPHPTRCVMRRLWEYEGVRREWRREPSSWRFVGFDTLLVIWEECEAGLWGARRRP